MSKKKTAVKPDPKAVAIWDDEGVEYGVLEFRRDAVGRYTPVIVVYKYLKPLAETFRASDHNNTMLRKVEALWLNEPKNKKTKAAIEEWDTQVNALIQIYQEAIDAGLGGIWYNAKYFNGGKDLMMIFSEIQSTMLYFKNKREAFADQISEIAKQERRERKADVSKWLKQIDEAIMYAAGIKV